MSAFDAFINLLSSHVRDVNVDNDVSEGQVGLFFINLKVGFLERNRKAKHGKHQICINAKNKTLFKCERHDVFCIYTLRKADEISLKNTSLRVRVRVDVLLLLKAKAKVIKNIIFSVLKTANCLYFGMFFSLFSFLFPCYFF
jgi:hypothetical protein